MSEIITAVLGIIVLAINCTTMFLTFETKRNLTFSIIVLMLFTTALLAIMFYTGLMGTSLPVVLGLVYLPVIMALFKGVVYHKVFAFFLLFNLTVFQGTLAMSVISLFFPKSGGSYYIAMLITLLTMYAGYLFLVFRFGRRLFKKLFIDGRRTEWILYAAGAIFSYSVATALRVIPMDAWLSLTLLFFVLWSFGVLCFAIVRTHEKYKQQYEAEFAREVISSGREHYQKMDEMHDKLRTLRHDFRYYLIAIEEYLADGNKQELRRCLDSMKTQLSEGEMHSFCGNSVINALLVCYAEHCAALKIAFTTEIDLPERLSVPNYDLCIVVGNLLENAVEACRKLPGCGNIELVLKPLGKQLALRVKNSFDGRVIESDGHIKSMKKDGGFGLRSIEAVAARYDGELFLDWQDSVFSAYVTVRL